MGDPFEELGRRIEQTRRGDERHGARDEEVAALREEWKSVFTALGQQVRDLVARLSQLAAVAAPLVFPSARRTGGWSGAPGLA